MIISLLLEIEIANRLKDKILPEDFIHEPHKEIVKILFEEYEKGNSNINIILEKYESEEEIISVFTKIMTIDQQIKDKEKAISNIINIYDQKKLTKRKEEIIDKLKLSLDKKEEQNLESELTKIIANLSKLKKV